MFTPPSSGNILLFSYEHKSQYIIIIGASDYLVTRATVVLLCPQEVLIRSASDLVENETMLLFECLCHQEMHSYIVPFNYCRRR